MTQKTAQSVGRGSAMRYPITVSVLLRLKCRIHANFMMREF